MSKPEPLTYRTTNWSAYNAALKQRGSLLIWFDPGTNWLAAPRGRSGRPAKFSDAAIQTCLTLKALFGLALRQTTGLVASLLKLAGLDWPVPDFSTLCRRRQRVSVLSTAVRKSSNRRLNIPQFAAFMIFVALLVQGFFTAGRCRQQTRLTPFFEPITFAADVDDARMVQ